MQRYGMKLSKDELKQLLMTAGIIAFVWSFNKWGDVTFDFFEGIKNLLIGFVFAIIALFFNQIGQRIVAIHYGYDPIYEYGILGLMVALVITFASRGYLVFFLPGAVNLRHLTASRLGEFRYYTNDWEWAKAGFQGPFWNILLAVFLSPFKANPYVSQLMLMNVLFAIYSLLPLPGNIGLYLFYPHIHFWTLTVGIVLACSAMVFFLNPILTLVIGVIIGIIAMWLHFSRDWLSGVE
jgi:hypothetical protein